MQVKIKIGDIDTVKDLLTHLKVIQKQIEDYKPDSLDAELQKETRIRSGN